jgi:hypothetical protein
MFRASRGRSGEDRFFAVKVALLVVGAALGIAGMAYEIGWLVWAAIAVVGTGIILRLLAGRRTD